MPGSDQWAAISARASGLRRLLVVQRSPAGALPGRSNSPDSAKSASPLDVRNTAYKVMRITLCRVWAPVARTLRRGKPQPRPLYRSLTGRSRTVSRRNDARRGHFNRPQRGPVQPRAAAAQCKRYSAACAMAARRSLKGSRCSCPRGDPRCPGGVIRFCPDPRFGRPPADGVAGQDDRAAAVRKAPSFPTSDTT